MFVIDSQKRASRKWDAKNMKVVGCKLKIEDAELFAEYAKKQGMTVNALLQKYILGCIGKADPKQPEPDTEG